LNILHSNSGPIIAKSNKFKLHTNIIKKPLKNKEQIHFWGQINLSEREITLVAFFLKCSSCFALMANFLNYDDSPVAIERPQTWARDPQVDQEVARHKNNSPSPPVSLSSCINASSRWPLALCLQGAVQSLSLSLLLHHAAQMILLSCRNACCEGLIHFEPVLRPKT